MNQQIKEFYRELDLEPGADLAAVRQSYLQLVKVWHPDRFGNDQKLQAVANDKLKRINFAYESLVAFFENGKTARPSTSPKAETRAF
jgi:curved DNA-binding protein CbpA